MTDFFKYANLMHAVAGGLGGATITGGTSYLSSKLSDAESHVRRDPGFMNKVQRQSARLGHAAGSPEMHKFTDDAVNKEVSARHRRAAVGGALLGGTMGAMAGLGVHQGKVRREKFRQENAARQKKWDEHDARMHQRNQQRQKEDADWWAEHHANKKKWQEDSDKWWDDFHNTFGSRGGNRRSSAGGGKRTGGGGGHAPSGGAHINVLHSELGLSGKETSKSEVRKAFHGMAQKHHPDKGGDPEKMKKVNAAWTDIQKHPWFEKLSFDCGFWQGFQKACAHGG